MNKYHKDIIKRTGCVFSVISFHALLECVPSPHLPLLSVSFTNLTKCSVIFLTFLLSEYFIVNPIFSLCSIYVCDSDLTTITTTDKLLGYPSKLHTYTSQIHEYIYLYITFRHINIHTNTHICVCEYVCFLAQMSVLW